MPGLDTYLLVLEHVEKSLRNTQQAILNTLSAPHASAALSIRQHTPAYVILRQHTQYLLGAPCERRMPPGRLERSSGGGGGVPAGGGGVPAGSG